MGGWGGGGSGVALSLCHDIPVMDGVIVTFKVTMALQKFLIFLGEKIATWQDVLQKPHKLSLGLKQRRFS